MKSIVWKLGFLFLFFCLIKNLIVYGKENQSEVGSLYAKSAVLMDGNSGRILYEKNGNEFMANASTTKILTCILALENARLEEVVTVSSYAASMPDVQLHIQEGETYYLGDLLYSLMLESHNDVAVAIAEHIAGSCEEFSKLMNRKAKEIGCKDTYFLTPNGLDAVETITMKNGKKIEKSHGTTAEDLARIMRYCVRLSEKKEEFLKITSLPSYSFGDIEGKRSFFCRNHNSLLQMMEGVISGKTGFTGKAGYCYVGALEKDGKSYVVALLACGWPGNKTYKWEDCKKLLGYGLENYDLFSLEQLEPYYKEKMQTEVENGITKRIGDAAMVKLVKESSECKELLLTKEEKMTVQVIQRKMVAPIAKKQIAGKLIYFINGEKWMEETLVCEKEIKKKDLFWCFKKIWCFFPINKI